MAKALDDAVAEDLSPEYIKRRVEDWAARLSDLYERVESWLPAGWVAERHPNIRMNEELMRDAGVPPRNLHSLGLSLNGNWMATFEPRGLWVIGANGRVDLKTRRAKWLLLDHSEAFASPDWRLSQLTDRSQYTPLSKDTLRLALNDA